MFPPPFVGDPRHRTNSKPMPDWFVRDMGKRIREITRLRLPVWPDFWLEFKLLRIKRAAYV